MEKMMNDLISYRCPGATCTNLTVFLGSPSSDKNSLTAFAAAVGSDVVVLTSKKVSDISQYCMSKLRRLAARYERVLFSDARLAHATVVEDCLAECVLHVFFDTGEGSLLSAISNVLNSTTSFSVQTVQDGDSNYLISFPEGVFSEEEFDAISEKVAEVCPIVHEDYIFQERYLFPSARIDLLTAVKLDDTFYGITKTTKYFQENMWTEGSGLLRSHFNYLENRTTIGDVNILKVDSLQELIPLIDPSAPYLAIDIETTGLDYHSAYHSENELSDNIGERFFFQEESHSHRNHAIISVSVSDRSDRAVVFLVDHPDYPEAKEAGLEMLKWLCHLDVPKVFHNAVFDLKWIQKYYGILVRGRIYDTMLQEHFLDENKDSYSLEGLTALRLNIIPHKSEYSSEQLTGSKVPSFPSGKSMTSSQADELCQFAKIRYTVSREKDFTKMPLKDLVKYSGLDAITTYRIFRSQQAVMRKIYANDKARNFIFEFLEKLLLQTINMEHRGIRLDVDLAREQVFACHAGIQEKISYLDSVFGTGNNYDSSTTMGKLIQLYFPELYNDLPSTNTGKLELTEEYLKPLSAQYSWISVFLGYRNTIKALNFLITLIRHSIESRLHPSFLLIGTATGRLSCVRPAIQTLPSELGGIAIKECLLPEPGQVLIQLDLKGAETRMLANLSKDEDLIAAQKEGMDLHALTASEFSGEPYDAILQAHSKDSSSRSEEEKRLNDLRSSAKAVNFGIAYGITEYGLSRQLGCSLSEARSMINGYYKRYPGVRKYFDKVKTRLYKHGFVENFIGRRRHLSDITHAPNFWAEKMVRQACNFMIQSSASDFFQHAVSGLLGVPGITLHMTVHDSVVFSYDESVLPLPELMSILNEIFIHKPKLLWPELFEIEMKFDLETGLTYGLGHHLNSDLVSVLQSEGRTLYDYLLSHGGEK
jgi:DNA polymerase I-like protein with 3'-5' exonuclease and polymerase domains